MHPAGRHAEFGQHPLGLPQHRGRPADVDLAVRPVPALPHQGGQVGLRAAGGWLIGHRGDQLEPREGPREQLQFPQVVQGVPGAGANSRVTAGPPAAAACSASALTGASPVPPATQNSPLGERGGSVIEPFAGPSSSVSPGTV